MQYQLTHSFRVDASGKPIQPPPTHGMAAAARYYYARDYAEAERCCRDIIAREPLHFDALHLLGVIHLDRAQLPDAIAWLTQAAQVLPDNARVHYHLGSALLGSKQFDLAVAELRQSLALDPQDAGTLNNLGNALAGMGQDEAALDCFRRTLALHPGHVPAQFNMGRALLALGQLEQAVACFRAASADAQAAAEPDRLADIYAGLGEALVGLRRYDEAFAACRAIAGVRPMVAEWNESLILLLLGRFAEGWRKYESRWLGAGHEPPREDARVPDLAEVPGKRILLIDEQGRGDIIQFSRYAPLLAGLGAHVTLKAYAELKPLLQTLDGIGGVIAGDEPEPPYDIVTPLLSLPLAFGTELKTIPARVPYLRVPADRLARWRKRLGRRRLPRIGLAWSGAVEHGGDRQRSIALSRLAPLLCRAGFEFHSVQKDVRSADLAWLEANPNLRHHGEALRDFADAAALIATMDLVIAVDTAAAHLAGALAKPVWIMLPYNADWRWLLDRDDSPWYPTARLFRQTQRGNWDGVVTEIVRALAEWPDRPRPQRPTA